MLRMVDHKNAEADYDRAKELRKPSTLAERLLWNELSKSAKIYGLKFRRQFPLHPYVVDFICLKAKLIIELDGPSHDVRIAQDERRNVFLLGEGYNILRFSNDDVRENLEGVTLTLLKRAQELIAQNNVRRSNLNAPAPNLSRKGRGD